MSKLLKELFVHWVFEVVSYLATVELAIVQSRILNSREINAIDEAFEVFDIK